MLLNMHSNLGMSSDTFFEILEKCKDQIALPMNNKSLKTRKCSSPVEYRLYVCLYWIRKYTQLTSIGDIFKLSGSTISKTVKHILPILFEKLDFIKFPQNIENYPKCRGATVAVDCCAHWRKRPHPYQAYYFNGFKRMHCLYVQATRYNYV